MRLDLETILILHPVSLITGAICFLSAGLYFARQIGLRKLAAAFILLASASLLTILGERQQLPEEFWSLTSFAVGSFAYALFWIGLYELVYERPLRHAGWIFQIPALMTLAAFVIDFHVFTVYRTSALLLTMVGFSVAGALLVMQDPIRERLTSRHMLSAVLLSKALLGALILTNLTTPDVFDTSAAYGLAGLIFCHFGTAMFALILVQQRTETRLSRLAQTDTLTGIRNRYWFYDQIPKEASPGDVCFAIDIDLFKNINDLYGHAAGDHVLIETARKMMEVVGSEAILARMGGEEFALFLKAAGPTAAVAIAESMRFAIQSQVLSHAGASLAVTVSIGVAVAEDVIPVDVLMRCADKALYEAKHQGRNRFELWLAPRGDIEMSPPEQLNGQDFVGNSSTLLPFQSIVRA